MTRLVQYKYPKEIKERLERRWACIRLNPEYRKFFEKHKTYLEETEFFPSPTVLSGDCYFIKWQLFFLPSYTEKNYLEAFYNREIARDNRPTAINLFKSQEELVLKIHNEIRVELPSMITETDDVFSDFKDVFSVEDERKERLQTRERRRSTQCHPAPINSRAIFLFGSLQ